jgi:alkaline phosphatase
VLAYDRAFQSVVDFLDNSDTEGALVATSDHETGGLAVARRNYIFCINFEGLANVFLRTPYFLSSISVAS